MILRSCSSSGHLRSKTRSLGQMIEKPCKHSRDKIFASIFVMSCQNVYLDDNKGQIQIGVMWVQKLGH